MKTIKKYFTIACIVASGAVTMTSCNDFLDREPKSSLIPETYFTTESQLEAYANDLYPYLIPTFETDNQTDNQAYGSIDGKYTTDNWRVPHSESYNWQFGNIYRCNYFFAEVLPRFGADVQGSANTISGDLSNIKHYIGEMYFLRAFEYFRKYMMFGDFPIVTTPLEDDVEVLKDASKRSPRSEVARFMLSDLDKAVQFLEAKDMSTTRINKDAALLLKSRIALVEGTWLKYFKGTAFVPQGEGWPGKEKEFTANYQFQSGSIEDEINFFLDEAMAASKEVAEKYKGGLTTNTGLLQQSDTEPLNPFYDMFAQEDLSKLSEVLLWRQYAQNISTHNENPAAGRGNDRIGVTRGLVNNFLMEDGTPVYTNGTYADGNGYYMGDKTLADVRVNRDSRLSLFLKEPGQKNILFELDNGVGTEAVPIEPIPQILIGEVMRGYSTGYALRKKGSFNKKHYGMPSSGLAGYTAGVVFRSAEALLNYMEASYERNGTLDNSAREYWRALRNRAQMDADFDKTISLTDMNKEAENDWGAYSAGNLIDPILYNIRRERRSEFMAEGLRYTDLRRWRSLDQLIQHPYHIEGFHLWNTPMENWYDGELIADESNDANVSAKERSEYLRPHQRYAGQAGFNGSTWMMAHYLYPIMIKQFQVTATNSADLNTSIIYQNPYWPLVADKTAEK